MSPTQSDIARKIRVWQAHVKIPTRRAGASVDIASYLVQ